ncbi:hypothetical protein [Paracoccus yeei]|uniref:hypothetical protein n=1 Tax=Paracoccus yeei TaxID=147645 RepID=UPI0012FDC322|nr:hypothetical protein [Paracoccus yeei]
MDVAFGREVCRNLGCDLVIGQAVEACQDESGQRRVSVDLWDAAYAMLAAVLGHGHVTGRQMRLAGVQLHFPQHGQSTAEAVQGASRSPDFGQGHVYGGQGSTLTVRPLCAFHLCNLVHGYRWAIGKPFRHSQGNIQGAHPADEMLDQG